MLGAADVHRVGIIFVIARQRANAIRREEFVFVQHYFQNSPQLLLIHDRKQTSLALARRAHAGHVTGQIWPIVNKPFESPLEVRQVIQHFGFQCFNREQWNQTNHRTHL